MTTETNLSENQKPASGFNPFMLVNAVLFIGLIILYGLFFFKPDNSVQPAENESNTMVALTGEAAPAPTSNIAYIHSETLMTQYLLAEKMRKDYEAEQNRLENDITRRQRSFQSEVEKFQNDISSGRISMDRAQQKEQELMLLQQELMQLSDTYTNRLMVKEAEMNNELFETISGFLERYNSEKGYDFILSYSRGGNLLFAKNSFDITSEVLALMNAEYSSANK